MPAALQADKFGNIFHVLAKDELVTFCQHRHVLHAKMTKRSDPEGSFKTSRVVKSMPFFERNSFVLRQLLQPGWVKSTNLSFVISIVTSSL